MNNICGICSDILDTNLAKLNQWSYLSLRMYKNGL